MNGVSRHLVVHTVQWKSTVSKISLFSMHVRETALTIRVNLHTFDGAKFGDCVLHCTRTQERMKFLELVFGSNEVGAMIK